MYTLRRIYTNLCFAWLVGWTCRCTNTLWLVFDLQAVCKKTLIWLVKIWYFNIWQMPILSIGYLCISCKICWSGLRHVQKTFSNWQILWNRTALCPLFTDLFTMTQTYGHQLQYVLVLLQRCIIICWNAEICCLKWCSKIQFDKIMSEII